MDCYKIFGFIGCYWIVVGFVKVRGFEGYGIIIFVIDDKGVVVENGDIVFIVVFSVG